jgi:hypothetical protein
LHNPTVETGQLCEHYRKAIRHSSRERKAVYIPDLIGTTDEVTQLLILRPKHDSARGP